MGNCCSKPKSPHHVSTPSSPLPIEPSLPASGDPLRPPAVATPMEPSLPTSGDAVPPPPPPVDVIGSSDQIEPSQHSLADSVHPSPLIEAIASVREMYQNIDEDPVERIDRLISFVENQLQKMNTPSEAGSSSSEGWLGTVQDSTKLAAKIIDTISTEAEKISNPDAVKSVTLNVIGGVGDSCWVFLGLAVAAYAVEEYLSVGSTEKKCREILLNILKLANDVIRISDVKEMLGNAVGTIVEGAILFCDYINLNSGKNSRFLSATTAAVQLEKTNKHMRDLMDSLVSSSLQQHWDKDVFLSHSGKQKNFVRQLREDLIREHVSCFFDEDRNSLPFAEKFPSLMLKAAETCKIAVVVLSKEFIHSKWPMIELSAFFRAIKSRRNAKLKIIPIFFEISPREVSRIKKDNPEWQNLNVSNYTRGLWDAALKEVRSINGLDFSKGGDEVDCRGKVVKEICFFLRGIKAPMLLEFEPVGIEEQVRDVMALLDMEGAQSVLAVNVCGFGGMGKSTVAASVVQSLNWSSMDFKFCRVAIDRRTQEKTSHIKDLQKIILSYLAGLNVDLKDTLDGRLKIKKALENKRSMLLIDNVIDKNDIKDLLPEDLSYSGQNTKLRIIITCREKNVRAKLSITCKEYEVKGLSYETSKSFLSKTIKQNEEVENLDPDEEERLINEVASACRGVPLLLSVFGQNLRGERNKDNYLDVLRVLRKGNLDSYRDEDLGTTLMYVYNKIKDDEVKEVFLDICAYFHGWKWNLVADIVDIYALNDLHRRMLVFKDGSGDLIVHDILLLMGMKKAKETRFSNWEKLSYALEGSVNVKGISLVNDSRLITIQSTLLEATHQSLRVLMLGDWVTLDGPPVDKAFRNLKYLDLGDITAFPFNDPSKLVKLRVFVNRSKPGMNLSHLPSSLKRVTHEVPAVECDEFVKLPFQNLRSLERFTVQTQKSVGLPKILHLPASVELPKELYLPASLVYVDLSTCKNIPKYFGHLTALESVILDSSDLDGLPQGFGKLKKLKHLSLDYCSKLTSLSEEIGMLSSLEALSMNGCRSLRTLPESMGGLLSLQTFEFSECIKLQELPKSFEKLHIQSLTLHSLVNLNDLPNSFGSMPLLKDLSFISCHSLMSLPNTFVQLERLENLNIIECPKLSLLPQDFGRLRCLKTMTVEECHLLKELPHGFGALPALKIFVLRRCNRFVILPTDFGELTSLEELYLADLILMSRIPDGFGKLQKLRFLNIWFCSQLKTLSDDFENMVTLERLGIRGSFELDGAVMEKIIKLPNCYRADIVYSRKLLEKWEHMQGETEHPIMVVKGCEKRDEEEEKRRAVKVALLHGKCVEVNENGELMERSSLLVGLEEGTTATVALIMLPFQMQSHQHDTLQRFVEMASKRTESNGSGSLQIVCARKLDLYAERPTAREEEERAEEEGIRQILLSLPFGSCAIPSSECKRVKILAECLGGYFYHKLSFFMANVGSDIDGYTIFKKLPADEISDWEEDEISGNVVSDSEEDEISGNEASHESIQNFIQSIYPVSDSDSDSDSDVRRADEQSQCGEREDEESHSGCVAGESKTVEFMEALKGNGIDYLLTDNSSKKVMVDDLHGKAIGLIICDFKYLECIKLQQIYKDLQEKDSNFMWIWIPVFSKDCGYGSYARLIQCMPWATFPHPHLVNVRRDHFESIIDPCFIFLDKDGQIANSDALPLLMGWGVKGYPFTQHTIPESLSLVESESCLEVLLHGMNSVGRKQMKNKMTFVHAQRPSECQKMCKELTQIHGSLEVLYVGKLCEFELSLGNLKQDYEDARQNMHCASLSFSDMIMFWYRCKYFASKRVYKFNKESNVMMKTLHGLAKQLCLNRRWLVLVSKGGLMTRGWLWEEVEDVLQMIGESSDDGEEVVQMLRKSLDDGELTPFVKTFHQTFSSLAWIRRVLICDVCGRWDDGNVEPDCGVGKDMELDLCENCESRIGASD